MKSFLIALMLAVLPVASYANDCSVGKFGRDSYKIDNSKMDKYGRFTSTLSFSKSGLFVGKGQYIVSPEGQFAYLETKYVNKENKLVAVVSTDYQGDGGFFTLCMGKDLKKNYSCTSCVIKYRN